MEAPCSVPVSVPAATRTRSLAVFLVVAGTGMLLFAAIYNGYPLTFWDTRAYVEHAMTLLPRPDRVIGYSLLLRALSFTQTLWTITVAQCALTAWLLLRTLETLSGGVSPRRYLLLLSGLTVGTALPWVAGQLIADIFTPALVLALFLLLEEPRLGRVERAGLLVLVAVCVTVHLTHLPIGLGLLAFAYLLSRALGPSRPARLVAPAAALFVGLAGIAGFNYSRSGSASLAPGSDAFLLGHLVDSGIAKRMLDEHCPERDYLLCPYRERLPMTGDTFLWNDALGVHPWERTREMSRESHRLLLDSLKEHPALHLRAALEYTARGFAAFETGEGFDNDAVPWIEAQIARFAPRDLPAYRAARQQSNALPVKALRAVHSPIAWLLSALVLVVIALSLRGGRERFSDVRGRFLAFVVAAILMNAVLTGNLSGINNRYGSRLLWLFGVALFGYLGRGELRALARPRTPPERTT